jgi:hypothetical protein
MAEGDISSPQDSLVWNALAVLEPRAVHVAGNIYAFSYEEHDNRGEVATVEIDNAGNVGAAIIDSLEFESTQIIWPDIIHVSGHVFAIVYSGVGDDGFLKTVTINNDGSIDNTVIDTFEFETVNCRIPKLFHVAGTTYGICYSKDHTGKLATITIAANGAISEPVVDTLVFDATNCLHSNTVKIADNIFAIFYNRTNGPGRVVTLTIADGGAITATPIDTLEIDSGVLMFCHGCQVDSDIFAYAYIKSDYKQYIKSIDIASNGNIGAVKDTLNFEPTVAYGNRLHLLRISSTIVCVTYSGPDFDGFMKTIEIDAAGAITDPVLSTLEFDATQGGDPFLMHISGNVYAVFYQGPTNYGNIKTPLIETPAAGRIKYLMITGVG